MLRELPKGYNLLGHYVIESVIGSGAFAIAYQALDTSLNHTVAIKEYFPRSLAKREEDQRVTIIKTTQSETKIDPSRPTEIDGATGTIHNMPDSQGPAVFAWGRDRFISEARTLARLKHAAIPQVFQFFETNGTAYMALELVRGETLASRMSRHSGEWSQAEVDSILEPLLDALSLLIEGGVVHRDITPNNIVIRRDGSPVLLDFGSARGALREPERYNTTAYTPSFAAPEQLVPGEPDGPFTDIYAMAAVIYRMISGELVPEASARRFGEDEYRPLARMGLRRYRREFLRAIDWGLSVQAARRPQSVPEWQAGLFPWKGLANRRALNRTRGRKVFISYRRVDAAAAARLIYDSLVDNFSADDIFFDVDSIPYGVDFRTHIKGSIIDSSVLVAVIGPGWVQGLGRSRWLFWRAWCEDFVRIELELAIEYGVPILPVLVNGGVMPRSKHLPRSIANLVYANASVVRLDTHLDSDLARVVEAVRQFRD